MAGVDATQVGIVREHRGCRVSWQSISLARLTDMADAWDMSCATRTVASKCKHTTILIGSCLRSETARLLPSSTR